MTRSDKQVVIYTGSKTKVYDGAPLTCSDYTATWGGKNVVDNKLAESDILEVMINGSITDAGTAKNTCSYRVVRDGKDVTNSYDIDVVGGDLTVEPRPIVINTNSASKTYDGTALKANGYTISGTFAGSDGFETVAVEGSRTNAGTVKNTLNSTTPYTLKEGTDASNYSITINPGELTVNKRKVTVTSGSAIANYSAAPKGGLTNDKITKNGDGFVTGEMAEGYPKASGKLSKPSVEPAPSDNYYADNTISYSWTGNGNPANYEITEIPGKLQIVNDSVAAITANDFTCVYDGKNHGSEVNISCSIESPGYAYKINGYPCTGKPSFTDAGTYKVDVTASNGKNVGTCSYTVTIKKRPITITAGSAEKVYDGEALICTDYIIGGDGFAEGEAQTIKMTAESVQTDAGTGYNRISELKDNGNFKQGNYDIAYFSGTLTVTPRPVTLTSDDLEVKYDGQAHSQETVKVGGVGFIDGQGVENYSGFTPATNAGTYLNKFDYSLKGTTKAGNYNITKNYGTLEITPRDITITSKSAEKAYDGTPLTRDGFTTAGDGYVSGEELKISVVGSITEVGKASNTITCKDSDTARVLNYNIEREEGTLKITDNTDLRVICNDQTYIYDGILHGEAAKAYIGSVEDGSTVWYAIGDSHIWTDEVPQVSELGTITVKARVYKENYKTAETSYTITVKKSESKPKSKSSGSSGGSWTAVPTVYGSPAAPISNGTWGSGTAGTWQYRINGQLVRNATAWITYKGADGKQYTGCFYFDKSGNMATGWQKIDNIWYFFDTAPGSTLGIMKTSGWITTDGRQYYVGADGKMLTNTTAPDGHKVDATGARID